MEAEVTKEVLDEQARALVMELGRRVYQVDLMTKEIEQLKGAILDLNVRAYKLEHPIEPEDEVAEQPEEPAVETEAEVA
jgi:hypothetical protein